MIEVRVMSTGANGLLAVYREVSPHDIDALIDLYRKHGAIDDEGTRRHLLEAEFTTDRCRGVFEIVLDA